MKGFSKINKGGQIKTLLLVLAFVGNVSAIADQLDSQVDYLLSQMTLEEKLTLLGGDEYTTRAIPRLNIPKISMTDGPLGVVLADKATAFPAGVALGASWNPALNKLVAKAIAEQAKAAGHHMVLGPCVNLHRQPFGGRNFESYSEDPHLTSKMSQAYVEGVQNEEGLLASVKHFAVNNQEVGRLSIDAVIDERTLHEVYLPAFKKAVDAGVWTVMAAYNKINGSYATENRHLLIDVLKNDWSFKGFVVSDWGATHTAIDAALNGLDLEMPQPRYFSPTLLKSEIEFGLIPQDVIEDKARRILRAIVANNIADTTPQNIPDQHRIALQAARESIVLLENKNNTLPLDKKLKSVLVLGPHAEDMPLGGHGSSKIKFNEKVSPLAALKLKRPDINFFTMNPENVPADTLEKTVTKAKSVIIFAGFNSQDEGETKDRKELTLPRGQNELIKDLVQWNSRTVVVMNSGGPILVEDWVDKAGAILDGWYLGQAGHEALAEVITGQTNPSGKLPVTFFKRWEDHPAFGSYPGDGKTVKYLEGIYVGYRHFDRFNILPRYEFGFGLSYTTFEIKNVNLVEPLKIEAEVTNMGAMAGAEVIQVYVKPPQGPVARPEKELRGFTKVWLKPGETKTAQIEIDKQELYYFDDIDHTWKFEPGIYELHVGTSSRQIKDVITTRLE